MKIEGNQKELDAMVEFHKGVRLRSLIHFVSRTDERRRIEGGFPYAVYKGIRTFDRMPSWR